VTTPTKARRFLPAALVVVACGSPGSMDGGSDAGSDAGNPCPDVPLNDAGMRCECVTEYPGSGAPYKRQYCDADIGNPCPIGCFNPREADGGRKYEGDAGDPVCFC
jgi:hypothetical protein